MAIPSLLAFGVVILIFSKLPHNLQERKQDLIYTPGQGLQSQGMLTQTVATGRTQELSMFNKETRLQPAE